MQLEERQRRMGKVFAGKQLQEGELEGELQRSWLWLGDAGGQRGPGGDTQSVAPSAEPGPELCSARERSRSFPGGWKCFVGAVWGHPHVSLGAQGVGGGTQALGCIPLRGCCPGEQMPTHPHRLFVGMKMELGQQKAGANLPW